MNDGQLGTENNLLTDSLNGTNDYATMCQVQTPTNETDRLQSTSLCFIHQAAYLTTCLKPSVHKT